MPQCLCIYQYVVVLEISLAIQVPNVVLSDFFFFLICLTIYIHGMS